MAAGGDGAVASPLTSMPRLDRIGAIWGTAMARRHQRPRWQPTTLDCPSLSR